MTNKHLPIPSPRGTIKLRHMILLSQLLLYLLLIMRISTLFKNESLHLEEREAYSKKDPSNVVATTSRTATIPSSSISSSLLLSSPSTDGNDKQDSGSNIMANDDNTQNTETKNGIMMIGDTNNNFDMQQPRPFLPSLDPPPTSFYAILNNKNNQNNSEINSKQTKATTAAVATSMEIGTKNTSPISMAYERLDTYQSTDFPSVLAVETSSSSSTPTFNRKHGNDNTKSATGKVFNVDTSTIRHGHVEKVEENLFLTKSRADLPSIYKIGHWDMSPIVVQEYKLVFFTQGKVACTVFKQLFRRLMGYQDWFVHKEPHIPHNPFKNGLKYLYHFSPEDAWTIMTSPDWTRAIFVRDPKERVLSAYLDKAARKRGMYVARHCCSSTDHVHGKNEPQQQQQRQVEEVNPDSCAEQASSSFEGFLRVISQHCCCDPHWKVQSHRIDEPFWKYVNFVGKFDNLRSDTQRMLERINAWEYGATGWGENGNEAIFSVSGPGAKHQTNAQDKIHLYYNSHGNDNKTNTTGTKSIEEHLMETFYADDYANPLFGFKLQ